MTQSSSVPEGSNRTLFTLLGVPWKVTPKSWRFLPTRIGFGVSVAFLSLRQRSIGSRLLYGVLYALLVLLTQVLHILGHTLGGRAVGAPMEANLILDTRILTHYRDGPLTVPRHVHLSRALGGPLANILMGVVSGLAWVRVGGHLLRFFVLVNLALGFGVLLPVRGLDGEILWRELFQR